MGKGVESDESWSLKVRNGGKAVADSEKVGDGWAAGPVGVENYRAWGGGLER